MMEQSLKKLIPKHQNSKGKIKSLKELRQDAADPEYASRISALALEEETTRGELELASTRKQIKREGLEAAITAVNSDPKNDPDAERNLYHGDTRDYTYRKSYQHADLAPGDEVKVSDVEASWNYPDQADPLALFYVEGVALSPLFKLAGRAGEFALGRMGNLWARNRIIGREFLNQSNRLQLPRTSTRLYTYGDGKIQLLSESGEPNGHMILREPLSPDLKGKLIGFVNKLNGATHASEDMYNVAVEHAKEELFPGLESGHDLWHPEITLHVTSKFPYEERLPLSFQNINGEWLLAPDTKAPYNIRLLTGQSGRPTPNRIFELTNHRLKVDDVYDGVVYNPTTGEFESKLVSEYWPSIRYGNIPAEGRTSLKMFERPTKTSLSERLGIPRGDRGNLNLDQVEALADLDLYLTSGQYRSTLRLTADDMEPYWGTLRSSDPAFVKVMHDMNILPRSGRYRVSYSSDTGRGTINYNLDTNMAGYSASANFPEVEGFRLGEANMYSDGPFQHNMILTSPRVDGNFTIDDLLSSNDPADVAKGQVLDKLPRVIDKNIMRDFWITNGKLQRPGSYATGDAGKFPLGHDLITTAAKVDPKKHKNIDLQNILLYGQRPLSELTISRRGVSPDSFRSIVKLGQREGNSLRWGEGFMSWNDSAIQDKYIYDAWDKYRKHLISEEEYMKIYNDWADQIGARHAQLQITPERKYMAKNNYGNMEEHTSPEIRRVVIPHPYVYKKKLGGKL